MKSAAVLAVLALAGSIPSASAEVYYRGTTHSFIEVPKAARLAPSPASFGGIAVVAGSTPQTSVLKIVNEGGAPSGPATVSATGPFRIVSTDCSTAVAPAGSCTVVFAPAPDLVSANGAVSGSIVVAGMGPVSLVGTASGYDPAVQIASGTLTLPAVTDGVASTQCTALQVMNGGGAAGLGGLAASFSGAGASNFAVCVPAAPVCSAAALAVGASCNLGVRLAAAQNGTYTATVNVTSSEGRSGSRTVSASFSGLKDGIAGAVISNATLKANLKARIPDGSTWQVCATTANGAYRTQVASGCADARQLLVVYTYGGVEFGAYTGYPVGTLDNSNYGLPESFYFSGASGSGSGYYRGNGSFTTAAGMDEVGFSKSLFGPYSFHEIQNSASDATVTLWPSFGNWNSGTTILGSTVKTVFTPSSVVAYKRL